MVLQLGSQVQDVLGPLAAQGRDDQHRLRALFVFGQRSGIALGVPMALVTPIFAEPLLTLLTGAQSTDQMLLLITYLLVISSLFRWLANGTAKRLLVITGRHRAIMVLSLVEAGLNIAVTITLLILWQQPAAAAVGTFGGAYSGTIIRDLPTACRHCGVRARAFQVTGRSVLAMVPVAAVLVSLRLIGWHEDVIG